MTYPIIPRPKQAVPALGLAGLALASLLGTSPSLAAAPTPNRANPSASEPVRVANLFRRIGDAIRDVGEIVETANTVDSLLQQMTGGSSGASQSQPPTAPQATTPDTSPAPAAAQPSRPPTAQASSNTQVLHRDDNPSFCQTADGDCEGFELARRVLPSGDAALIFSYYFNGTPTSFISRDEPDGQQNSVTGYTALLFDNDSSSRMEAFCEVGSMGSNPYGLVGCSIRNGPRFVYLNEQ